MAEVAVCSAEWREDSNVCSKNNYGWASRWTHSEKDGKREMEGQIVRRSDRVKDGHIIEKQKSIHRYL